MAELILGVHAGANASAAIGDGCRLLYCVQEERLAREKGYMGFPRRAIAACLAALGAVPADIAHVAYGSRFGSVDHCPPEEFLHRLGRFHQNPGAARAEADMVACRPDGMAEKFARLMAGEGFADVPITFHDHHTAHGAAAYYGLRADPATPYLVLTCDGFGDGACATVATWCGDRRHEHARTDLRNSLGLLYFWATHGYGFVPHQDEHKLMGMAPHASPARAGQVSEILRRHLGLDESGLRFQRSGTASVEQSWPRIAAELHGRRFDDVFGGLQQFTEALLTAWAEAAVVALGIRRVLAGGGVFMNVKANRAIAASPTVDSFQAFPSCGDESLAIGAYYLQAAAPHGQEHVEPLAHCYLGGDISDTDAKAALARTGYAYDTPGDIHGRIARLLADGQIVARCAGRMEFGARALGNRSILADPRNADIPRVINRLVKRRDFWMPFAPAILASRQHDYLANPKALASPYMMMAFDTAADPREMIAAVHPADLTARAQLVDDEPASGLRDILRAFEELTGRAALLNTSLNLSGQPIAATAADALGVFARSDLRYMQLGLYLVRK